MSKTFTPKGVQIDLEKDVANTIGAATKVRIANTTSREHTVVLQGPPHDPSLPETNSSANLAFDEIKGTGFRADVTVTDSGFTSTGITGGSNYNIGDVLKVDGDDYGGTTDTNDAKFRVDTVDSDGGVTGHTVSGTAPTPNVIYNDLPTTLSGSGLNVTVVRDGAGAYTVTINNGGTGYITTNVLNFPMALGNDTTAQLQIGEVDSRGSNDHTVVTASVTQGTTLTGQPDTYSNLSPTYLGGSGARLNVKNTGGHTVTATFATRGTGYRAGDTVRVLGTSIGASGDGKTFDAFFGFLSVDSAATGVPTDNPFTKFNPQIPISDQTYSNQAPEVVSLQADSNRTAGKYSGVAYTTNGTVTGKTYGTINVTVGSSGGITELSTETHGSHDRIGDVVTIDNSVIGGGSNVTFKIRSLLLDNTASTDGSFFMFGNSAVIIEKDPTDKIVVPESGFKATDISK